jgi:hypothetical protein
MNSPIYAPDSNYDSNYSSWLLKGLRKKFINKKLEKLNLCTSKAYR